LYKFCSYLGSGLDFNLDKISDNLEFYSFKVSNSLFTFDYSPILKGET